MIAFNLDKALSGGRVVTRGNIPVEQIMLFYKTNSDQPVYGVVRGDIACWSRVGKFLIGGRESVGDLFMENG